MAFATLRQSAHLRARSRSKNIRCASLILFSASARGKNSARSISGKACILPEWGGHSISNVLLASDTIWSGPTSNAQACTVLLPCCFIDPRSTRFPCSSKPISSRNSRAAAFKSSPSSCSPFGMLQAPSSFFFQTARPDGSAALRAGPPCAYTLKLPHLS